MEVMAAFVGLVTARFSVVDRGIGALNSGCKHEVAGHAGWEAAAVRARAAAKLIACVVAVAVLTLDDVEEAFRFRFSHEQSPSQPVDLKLMIFQENDLPCAETTP